MDTFDFQINNLVLRVIFYCKKEYTQAQNPISKSFLTHLSCTLQEWKSRTAPVYFPNICELIPTYRYLGFMMMVR